MIGRRCNMRSPCAEFGNTPEGAGLLPTVVAEAQVVVQHAGLGYAVVAGTSGVATQIDLAAGVDGRRLR